MSTFTSALIDRLRWARKVGVTFGGKRDTYVILGYKDDLSYEDYRGRYYRDGIAKRIVEAYPAATWRGGVELFEDEDPNVDTKFELAWRELEGKFSIWQKLQAVDILAGLSTYAVLLIGAPGGLTEPLPQGKPGDLLYFQPFSGGGGPGNNRTLSMNADCTIEAFDTDSSSPRFGEPLFYQLRRTTISAPLPMPKVHWTRILHVAEGCLEDNVYGTPTLENVWNLLDDLAKVTGGGAEAFWLRANAGIHLDVDKDMALAAAPAVAAAATATTAAIPAATTQAELDNLKQQAEDYANQLTRMIRTRGVAVTQLGSDVANFGPSADAILKQIGGSKGIPTRILTGSEMGTLASEQDAANFDSQVQDRRTGYAGPCIVRRLVDRLIEYGYLPTPKEYQVGWPVEENLDETGKADYAGKLATVNSTYGSVVFTAPEIRDMAFNLKPLTPAEIEAATPEPPEPPPAPIAPELKAAEDGELLRVLEAAIACNNTDVIDEIIGVHRAAQDGPHKYATTQLTLPAEITESILALGRGIPDEDLAADGRETDAHVTVKYGLIDPDAGKLAALISHTNPASVYFGMTAYFETPDYDVVYVSVTGGNLADLNSAIANGMECAPSDHGAYVPHATVAYVKAGLGGKYAGLGALNGMSCTSQTLTLVSADGERSEVGLA